MDEEEEEENEKDPKELMEVYTKDLLGVMVEILKKGV